MAGDELAKLPLLEGMPPAWRVVEFGEVLEGSTRNGIYKPKAFHGRGAKIINMGELFAHPRLKAIEMRRVELMDQELARFEVHSGDLLFARRSLVAEGAGKCSIVLETDEPTTFESSIIRARPDNRQTNSLFLYYLFGSPFGAYSLGSILRHVAVAGITGSDLVKLPIPLPPVSEQRAIAYILGTLDDKIELNRRMNETLEEMARAIFKSWFVDFDPVRAKSEGRDPGLPRHIADLFPDHFQNSEGQKIPAGWSVGTLGEVAENPRRSVKPAQMEESMPYIGLEHMPRRSISLTEWESSEGLESNKYEFKRGEILFGKLRPYFHKVGIAPVDGICSTDILVITAKQPEWFGFVLGHVSSDDFVSFTTTTSSGTKMPRTNWKDMSSFDIVMPPTSLAKAFDLQAQTFTDRIVENIYETRILAETRDTLLPKLVSGELRVPDAERFVEGRL